MYENRKEEFEKYLPYESPVCVKIAAPCASFLKYIIILFFNVFRHSFRDIGLCSVGLSWQYVLKYVSSNHQESNA